MNKKENKVLQIERVQTGVRMEKRILKVLKGVAEYLDISLGELLEIMALHNFEGRHPFTEENRRRITKLKEIYEMNYDAHAYERFCESKRSGMED